MITTNFTRQNRRDDLRINQNLLRLKLLALNIYSSDKFEEKKFFFFFSNIYVKWKIQAKACGAVELMQPSRSVVITIAVGICATK